MEATVRGQLDALDTTLAEDIDGAREILMDRLGEVRIRHAEQGMVAEVQGLDALHYVVELSRHDRTATADAAKTVGVSPRTVEQAVYVRQPRAAPLDDAQPP